MRRAVGAVRARKACPLAAVQGAAEAVASVVAVVQEAAVEAVVDHAAVAAEAGGSHENIQNINV